MKKIISMILVFIVSLSLVGVATAAALKPPASVCLNAAGGGIYALVVKPSSAVKMLDGTQKFYSIQGAIIVGFNMPLVGSGYMAGNTFHFSFTSTYNNAGTPVYIQAEGFYDVVAKTGTEYIHYSNSGDFVNPLTPVPCTNYDILYGQEIVGSQFLPPNP